MTLRFISYGGGVQSTALVAMSHIAAERDAERAARERAEAEARQLREAIGDPDELIANAHYGRAANGHGDDLFATVSRIAAAVAEGAEDRGQTGGGSTKR